MSNNTFYVLGNCKCSTGLYVNNINPNSGTDLNFSGANNINFTSNTNKKLNFSIANETKILTSNDAIYFTNLLNNTNYAYIRSDGSFFSTSVSSTDFNSTNVNTVNLTTTNILSVTSSPIYQYLTEINRAGNSLSTYTFTSNSTVYTSKTDALLIQLNNYSEKAFTIETQFTAYNNRNGFVNINSYALSGVAVNRVNNVDNYILNNYIYNGWGSTTRSGSTTIQYFLDGQNYLVYYIDVNLANANNFTWNLWVVLKTVG
jgi:hypothetical protein